MVILIFVIMFFSLSFECALHPHLAVEERLVKRVLLARNSEREIQALSGPLQAGVAVVRVPTDCVGERRARTTLQGGRVFFRSCGQERGREKIVTERERERENEN